MKITLQDEDVRKAVATYVDTLGFKTSQFDCAIEFTKARKSGEISAEVELTPVSQIQTAEVPSGPLNFGNDATDEAV